MVPPAELEWNVTLGACLRTYKEKQQQCLNCFT